MELVNLRRGRAINVLTGLLVFFMASIAQAESYRFIPNEAIISHARKTKVSNHAAPLAFAQLQGGSFDSLGSELLTDSSFKVIEWRKARRRGVNKSQKYISSRSPCNAPTVKRLLRRNKGMTCEPNWEGEINLTPNDKFYSSMYAAKSSGAAAIGLPSAWDKTTGSQNVVVGIIDTGIDYNHSDLRSNVWVNSGEIPANGIDEDQNGFVDDMYGIDSYNNDNDPLDDQSHGTHVAGTIGAVGNDTKGIVGINWQVKMVSCKAFGSNGTGTLAGVLKCITYLNRLKTQLGFNIVAFNNSYGGFPYSQSMSNAIEATKQAGIVFVAGAGNSSQDNDANPFYPASYPQDNIIAVGAVDSAAKMATFSNFGLTSVDLFAPGVGILSTIRGNNWAFYNGTSMATPHVTGAIALLKAYLPDTNYLQSIDAILNGSKSMANLSGFAKTGALLNVNDALDYAAAHQAPVQSPTPTSTSTPHSTPTTAPSPTATATPQPTQTPTPQPTATMTPTPKVAGRMSISVKYLPQSKIEVTCTLTNSGAPFPGTIINLAVQGASTWKSPANSKGIARFLPSLGKRSSYSARCSAKITDANTKDSVAVYSEIVTIKGSGK